MGIGDWGLGIGDWGMGIGGNGESLMTKTQYSINKKKKKKKINNKL